MKGITEKMMLTIFGIVGALLLLIVFITYLVLALAPACWQNTLSDLEKLTGETQLGFGKLLGKEEFYLPVRLTGDCSSFVRFTNYDGCIDDCRGYDDSEKCAKECLKCKDAKGCIVAVPVKPSKWTSGAFWNFFRSEENSYFTRVKLAFLDLFRVYRSDFQFGGETSFQAPDKGKLDICLHFKKSENSIIYSITPKENTPREACK